MTLWSKMRFIYNAKDINLELYVLKKIMVRINN